MQIDYSGIPEHMRDGTKRYIESGIPPGSFLEAVICNDLRGAFMRADHINVEAMKDWAMFFYNDVPGNCHGSPEVYDAWIKQGGMGGAE